MKPTRQPVQQKKAKASARKTPVQSRARAKMVATTGGSSSTGAPAKTPSPASNKWPELHDVFFRPNRMKYVRQHVKVRGCVFCASRESGISLKGLCLYQTAHSMVILNKYPYNNGHLLILPKRHTGNFGLLEREELLDLQIVLQTAILAVETVYGPHGINVGLNLGSAAGAGIPEHLHYHIIPRWRGDTNFFPLIGRTKIVIETLEQTFKRLLPFFSQRDKRDPNLKRRKSK